MVKGKLAYSWVNAQYSTTKASPFYSLNKQLAFQETYYNCLCSNKLEFIIKFSTGPQYHTDAL